MFSLGNILISVEIHTYRDINLYVWNFVWEQIQINIQACKQYQYEVVYVCVMLQSGTSADGKGDN